MMCVLGLRPRQEQEMPRKACNQAVMVGTSSQSWTPALLRDPTDAGTAHRRETDVSHTPRG